MPRGIFLGLGSNLGDRESWLREACREIETGIGNIVASSSLYETSPWGFDSEEYFLNQVIEIETSLPPGEIMEKITLIEKKYKRERKPGTSYSSRTLDIDLLYYRNKIYHSDSLVIPHPRMEYRKFVLQPLTEIGPDFIHPILQKTNSELLEDCVDDSEVYIYHPPQ
jgi:2-amino-4-hydroxy-6-hydroxymethyldihydropteridine diphosphokinase